VWRALLNIPFGKVVSYGDVANSLGMPGAARAVGSAIAQNQLAYLIPCHRIIRTNGVTGEYRWGKELKQNMIAVESVIRST
jgi:AraC family transcriptional regulator of adaptative response/methylated-DNA-[protein]-cysteine methyltransferase